MTSAQVLSTRDMKDSPTTPLYNLEFDERPDYLRAYVTGEHDNFNISSQYWSEIAKKLAELGIKRVLVVEEIAEQSPMIDVFQLVSELADRGFRGIKVAFVDKFSSHQDLNDFGVLVGTNRGLFGKAFDNEAEAEAWLLGDSN